MAIPYQPTYSIQPKYGFRYGPSTFAPAVTSAATPPPTYGLDGSAAAPPQVLGTQQGVTQSWQDDPFQSDPNKIPAAQTLGYAAGTQNPLGLLSAVVPPMGALQSLTGYDTSGGGKYTYGNYQTYDTEGNVFGPEGRAYDPVTGAAAQSYGSTGDWLGGWVGIGTPEGAFGSSSSYGKLRAAGEDIPNSLLGSYANSTYNVPNYMNAYGASAADKAGVDTINSRVAFNTQMATGNPMYGYAEDDLDRLNTTAFTDASQFGFSPSSMRYTEAQKAIDAAAGNVTYGTDTGNYFSTSGKGVGGSEQSGFVNESGQVVTPDGTLVSINDALGNKHSLLNTPTQNFRTLQNISNNAAIAAEAFNPETGESDDSDWGTGGYEGTGGFGTATSSGDFDVSNAASYANDIDDIEEATGVEYDDPSNDSGDSGDTHCCTAAEKRGDMSLTEVKKLRAWHRKQSIVWQEGYDIWGKVIADHLVAKSKWQSDRVRDFYNHKIYGKRTIGSVYADIVIYPMSMLIGCGVLLSSFITRGKDNETKKSF